ncbi:MAG: hypothetical protein DME23_20385 [Verrucomicrobia bacterium]|nr:MAG: hypothetical protein DME23_20385 [Verrucomicrobiota bacterium]
MNNQFDELTKGLAQSVTRRAALKKFGVGLAGMALAGFLWLPAEVSATALGSLIELSRPNAVGTCDSHFISLLSDPVNTLAWHMPAAILSPSARKLIRTTSPPSSSGGSTNEQTRSHRSRDHFLDTN